MKIILTDLSIVNHYEYLTNNFFVSFFNILIYFKLNYKL